MCIIKILIFAKTFVKECSLMRITLNSERIIALKVDAIHFKLPVNLISKKVKFGVGPNRV